MPRELSTTIQTAIAQDLTAPTYLIWANIGGVQYRWTTAGVVFWDGFNWLAAGVSMESIEAERAAIRFGNADNSASALILGVGVRDAPFIIYEHHDTDAVEIFRGYGGESTIDKVSAVVNVYANPRNRSAAPLRRITAKDFSHLPQAGSEIRWGDTILIVEAE